MRSSVTKHPSSHWSGRDNLGVITPSPESPPCHGDTLSMGSADVEERLIGPKTAETIGVIALNWYVTFVVTMQPIEYGALQL